MDYEAWPALMWGGCTSPISANDLLLPRIGENSPDTLGVHVNLAVVNPYSDQPEEAMAYLEYLALHNGMDDYMLYADMTQPLLNEHTQQRLEEIDQALAELAQQEQNAEVRDQVLALEQEREFTADNLYLIGEADIAAWQKAAAAWSFLRKISIPRRSCSCGTGCCKEIFPWTTSWTSAAGTWR